MSAGEPTVLSATVDEIYRTESRRVLATLIRLLGDFDLAEEAMHDAFTAALTNWGDGIPANPRAWLISTGRFKAIDHLRRQARFAESSAAIAEHLASAIASSTDDETVGDDRLRLIFTCCHPALSPEARIALTLREVCGLQTEQIAHAFLVPAPTLAQRIVRAKAKIRDAGIPYQLPSTADVAERLDGVLQVIYLVFNEGYSASSGSSVTLADLSVEAIRLGRLLVELLPTSESRGLLALMLLHDARRLTRASPEGDLVLLEEQDRARWNREQIAEGCALVDVALRAGSGSYAVQAAIAALHAGAPSSAATDWTEIAGLYDVLLRQHDSPIIALNRAVAIAMRDGAAAGLVLIDEMLASGDLAAYHLAHSARAELCRRLGQDADALASYRTALSLVQQGPERRFLERRIAAISL